MLNMKICCKIRISFFSFDSLEKIRTPIMILHAEDDHIVPFASAQEVWVYVNLP